MTFWIKLILILLMFGVGCKKPNKYISNFEFHQESEYLAQKIRKISWETKKIEMGKCYLCKKNIYEIYYIAKTPARYCLKKTEEDYEKYKGELFHINCKNKILSSIMKHQLDEEIKIWAEGK